MSKALLICNGEQPGNWLKKLAKETDFILAADGGANAALAAGIKPHAVIGDLDSLSARTHRLLKNIPILKIDRQDNTDLEKALDWLVKHKFADVTIVGATGGRLDFTLGNILLVRPYLKHLHITFQGPNWILYPCLCGGSFSVQKGARLSLIALSYCRGVTLTGCRYPLTRQNIGRKHIGRTLSNQATASNVSLSFLSGFLLVYIENISQKKRI